MLDRNCPVPSFYREGNRKNKVDSELSISCNYACSPGKLLKCKNNILYFSNTPLLAQCLNGAILSSNWKLQWRVQNGATHSFVDGTRWDFWGLLITSWFPPYSCSDKNELRWLHFNFSLSCIGDGNGNPLQCSCLENPRDGRGWWAAVYGVA